MAHRPDCRARPTPGALAGVILAALLGLGGVLIAGCSIETVAHTGTREAAVQAGDSADSAPEGDVTGESGASIDLDEPDESLAFVETDMPDDPASAGVAAEEAAAAAITTVDTRQDPRLRDPEDSMVARRPATTPTPVVSPTPDASAVESAATPTPTAATPTPTTTAPTTTATPTATAPATTEQEVTGQETAGATPNSDAASPESTVTPSPTPEPRVEASPTPAATSDPVATATTTPIPTSTPAPSPTPLPTAAPTSTPQPTPTPGPTPCPHQSLGDVDQITTQPSSGQIAIATNVIDCSGSEAFARESVGGIDFGDPDINAEFFAQLPEDLGDCVAAELLQTDRRNALLGLIALSAGEPVAPSDQAATIRILRRCAPPEGMVGALIAALVPSAPEFAGGVNPVCAAAAYAEPDAGNAFWSQLAATPVASVASGLTETALVNLFAPILGCMSFGTVIVNDAALNGVAVAPTTIACIDQAVEGTGLLVDLFTGVLDPDDANIASILIDCLSGVG